MSREHEILKALASLAERLRHLETLEPAAGNPQALDVVTNDIEVVNTNVETTIYIFTVPGGTLGTNNLLRLKIVFSYLNNFAAAQNYTVGVNYGGSPLVAITCAAIAQNASRWIGVQEIVLKGNGATNAQRALLRESKTRVTTVHGMAGEGTSAEDSTADKDLEVTIRHLSAQPTVSFIRRAATLELMEAL